MLEQPLERITHRLEARLIPAADHAVVPFDAVAQRGPGQIRAADEGCALLVLPAEDVALRMEAASTALEDAQRPITLQVEQRLEPVRLGRVHVVASEEAQSSAAI